MTTPASPEDFLREFADEIRTRDYEGYPASESHLRGWAKLLKLREDGAKQVGYLEAANDKQSRYLSRRQLHMLDDIKAGGFTTYYNYAKRVGITHQAAQQVYKLLVSKGLVPKLTTPNNTTNTLEDEVTE